jgi:hypothetical protein
MTFDVQISRSADYVRYNAHGTTSLKRFGDLFSFVAADIDLTEDAKILIDLTGVQGRLTVTEQFLLGEIVALKLPYVYKLASLVPPGEITRNTERVAAEKGLAVRVFDTEKAAIAWLTEPDLV